MTQSTETEEHILVLVYLWSWEEDKLDTDKFTIENQ